MTLADLRRYAVGSSLFPPTTLKRAIDDIRRKWVPDGRLGVFDVTVTRDVGAQHSAPLLSGVTSSRSAQEALRRFATDAGIAEEVCLLPDATVGQDAAAVVTAALAPLLGEATLSAPRVSEALTGPHQGALHVLVPLRHSVAKTVHYVRQTRIRQRRVLAHEDVDERVDVAGAPHAIGRSFVMLVHVSRRSPC